MNEKRVQSPSSIKTYKQCPRKYYYQYIIKLATTANIHTVRGNITHSVLEHFFDIDTSVITLENAEAHLKLIVQHLLLKEWQNAKQELDKLGLTKDQLIHYFEDTLIMLFNWVELFLSKISRKQGSFAERFKKLTPMRELLFVSENYHAKGIIDAIETAEDGSVRIMDYKTSSSQDLNDHILQLAIYSLLYYDKHGQLPKQVGIYFLKGKESIMDVDEKLLELAKKEIAHVHEHTKSEDINHYQKQPSGLCKFSTGQCDFYDTCRPFE
ncbi:PD-(D/E)XK nuclease family protein [Candidatus Woesearchaeota archaeon]|nr:PD-(D/E)XK nuclease family protein [Candidatus Woesearchaeota archaeon]